MVLPAPPRQPGLEVGAQLVAQLRTAEIRIPPYPAVASQLDRLSQDPRSTIADVTAVVATDAALVATVLRRVSSAAMKSGAPATLEAAIGKLGLDELIRVVIATTVGAAASAPGPLAVLRRDQWRRSLLAAMFCRELAARRGIAPAQGFLAGLLHDFGAIVLLTCLEGLGAAALPVLPEASWRRLVEQHHIELGMVVVARWNLPEPLAEVMEHHHTPETCMRLYRPLVQLVAIADQIIEILDRTPHGGIAALAGVPGLEHDERYRIGALMPKVAEQMAQFETPAERQASTRVADPEHPAADDSWPVDFIVESRGGVAYRAEALRPGALAFRSPAALQPSWLSELTLRVGPQPVTLLFHVTACRRRPDGEYAVTAQPFGLAGADERAWQDLIAATQRPPARP